MTPQIGFLFALLAVMVYLFLTEKLPVDLTAFLGLVILVFTGFLTPAEAFTGFSSPAVITMLAVFIVGASLLETGVADIIGGKIHAIVGNSELRLIVVLMVTCGVLSAFMNNIAATAVLMPAVASIARRAGLAPSRLFMPLAFGAILGGTTTLVGTPPNILSAEMLSERGLEPFKLFDFTPIGLALLGLGVVFMLTLGRKLLPEREQPGLARVESRDLSQVYQLEDRLFSIRLPANTPLDGKTLAQTRLGNTLGVKVLTIIRGGERLVAEADSVLRGDDVLFVDSRATDLGKLLQMQDLEVEEAGLVELPGHVRGVAGVRARVVEGSPLVGHNLRELRFRDRLGLVVVGVRRRHDLHRRKLADWVLAADDEIFALGKRDRLADLARHPDFEVLETGLAAVREQIGELHLLRIPEGSALADTTIRDSRLGELVGLTVTGLIRGDETRLAISPEDVLQSGDRLLIAGKLTRLRTLVELGEVLLEPQGKAAAPLESEEVGMVEAVLAPRSAAIGHTLAEVEFQSRYGLLALALWREGKPHHVDFADAPLRLGDALLLHGPRDKIRRLAGEPDYVVLSQADQAPRRLSKAKWAFGALLLMVALVATGTQPIHVASFTAASLAILFGALTMQEAYKAIEWKAIFLVAAVLPVGMAMERTGAAMFLADLVTRVAGPLGNHVTLAAMVVLASMLSQGLDGAPTVVLLAPVVINTAESLGVSPYPMMMGVSLAASAAFMTPFSHKANLLVMGAGGYKASDYLKVGTPLTILVFVLLVVLVPIFFPF